MAPLMPALAKIASIGPNRSTLAAIMACTSAGTETSAACSPIRGAHSPRRPRASFSSASSRSTSITCAPSPSSRRAAARPRLPAPPVTMQCLPSMKPIGPLPFE